MTPLALFLIACATIFFGTIEAAFSTLMRLSLRLMAERGGRSDRLGHYLGDPLQLFVPIRVMLGLCIILAGVFIARASGVQESFEGDVLLQVLREWRSVAIFIVSLVAFVVVCEHLVPAFIARINPERVLDATLPVFSVMARPVAPLTSLIIDILNARREREAPNGGGAADVHAQASAPGENAPEEGVITDAEGRELLQSIVDFTETVVREVMTPRPDIIAIRQDASLADLRTLFREELYSRMPVYRDSFDNIVGVVFVKDLVALPPGAEPPITTLMRSAYFVPESKRVSELLKEMQRRQMQMAIVVDEYGGTAGLVTVEDLLEEIVGEIRDEYDVESETVTEEAPGVFVFSGKVSIDEVGDRLGVGIEREGVETVGGFLLSHLGRMPYVGETFDVEGLSVEVLEVERRRITKVRVRRQSPLTIEAGP